MAYDPVVNLAPLIFWVVVQFESAVIVEVKSGERLKSALVNTDGFSPALLYHPIPCPAIGADPEVGRKE